MSYNKKEIFQLEIRITYFVRQSDHSTFKLVLINSIWKNNLCSHNNHNYKYFSNGFLMKWISNIKSSILGLNISQLHIIIDNKCILVERINLVAGKKTKHLLTRQREHYTPGFLWHICHRSHLCVHWMVQLSTDPEDIDKRQTTDKYLLY